MSQSSLPGPCAGYEFDLVDLLDGALATPRAAAVRAHVAGCERCNAWLGHFAAVDTALAQSVPRPALPADFGAKLMQRIEGLAMPANRGVLRAVADLEYQQAVRDLGRSARSSAVSVAALAACVAAVVTSLAVVLWPAAGNAVRSLEAAAAGHLGSNVMGTVGAAAALCALGWSALQGLLPGVRLRR